MRDGLLDGANVVSVSGYVVVEPGALVVVSVSGYVVEGAFVVVVSVSVVNSCALHCTLALALWYGPEAGFSVNNATEKNMLRDVCGDTTERTTQMPSTKRVSTPSCRTAILRVFMNVNTSPSVFTAVCFMFCIPADHMLLLSLYVPKEHAMSPGH